MKLTAELTAQFLPRFSQCLIGHQPGRTCSALDKLAASLENEKMLAVEDLVLRSQAYLVMWVETTFRTSHSHRHKAQETRGGKAMKQKEKNPGAPRRCHCLLYRHRKAGCFALLLPAQNWAQVPTSFLWGAERLCPQLLYPCLIAGWQTRLGEGAQT